MKSRDNYYSQFPLKVNLIIINFPEKYLGAASFTLSTFRIGIYFPKLVTHFQARLHNKPCCLTLTSENGFEVNVKRLNRAFWR